jgi:uncharacterized protein (TIGR02001 family)
MSARFPLAAMKVRTTAMHTAIRASVFSTQAARGCADVGHGQRVAAWHKSCKSPGPFFALQISENLQMNKSLLALAALAALTALPSVSQAEDASPLSFNVSLTSDYRYRGISQTRLNPALQGGADYAAPNGFYVGTWASTIQWIKDAGTIAGVETGSANIEWDIYGGYKGEIQKDFGYDVGLLQYVYPNNKLGDVPGAKNANTLEIYGALSYGPATLKYSHSLTTLFGFANSKGSGYVDLSATFDVGGFSVAPHVGYQRVKGNSDFSYTDYSVTVSKDWAGVTLSAALVGTDTKSVPANPNSFAYFSPAGKDLGRSGLVVAVKKTF